MSRDRKKIYMWTWVIGITAVIGIIWIALTNYNISAAIMSTKNSKASDKDTLSELKSSLQKQMDEIDKIMVEYASQGNASSSVTSMEQKNR